MQTLNINSPKAPAPAGGYSQAVRVTAVRELLFISGQIPEDPDGHIPADFKGQARLAWANVLAQLESAGMRPENLAKVTIYLSSRDHALENREVRSEILGTHAPALTVVITGIFDERWLLEIEGYAVA